MDWLLIIKKYGCQKFVFFSMFGCCLFVCRLVCLLFVLQWSSRSALFLVMEWVPCCMMDGFYGDCESHLWKTVGVVVYKERRNGVEGKL